MKSKFPYMDPKMIMSVVVALIILAVGVFAYFTAVSSINQVPATSDSKVFRDVTPDIYDISISGATIVSVETGPSNTGPWSAYSGSYTYSGTEVTIS